MWRKSDIQKRWQALYPTPDEWKEHSLAVSPSVNNRGVTRSRVSLVHRKSSDQDKLVLNPDLVNITSLIESGVTIDPKSVRSMLNITDRADIEALNTTRSENVYKYLIEHEDEIFTAAGKVNPKKN